MKVLHITNNFPSEKFPIFGIFVKEQILSLNNLGITNDIFFINTREKGKFYYIISIFKLHRHLLLNKYDIIHCHHAYSGLVLLLSGLLFFNNTIISYQSNPSIEGGKKLFLTFHLFTKKIIFKSAIDEYINFKKIIVIPNGVNIDYFKPMDKKNARRELGLDPELIYILFMDSYNKRPYKREDRFNSVIEALKLKNKNIVPIKLTNTERNKIPLYINACDIHLLTSDIEGSPNSVKECLACNTNVVCTPVGDTVDLLRDVKGSFVCDSMDIDNLSDLVEKSINSKLSNGRKMIIEKKLDADSIAFKIYTLYLNIKNGD